MLIACLLLIVVGNAIPSREGFCSSRRYGSRHGESNGWFALWEPDQNSRPVQPGLAAYGPRYCQTQCSLGYFTPCGRWPPTTSVLEFRPTRQHVMWCLWNVFLVGSLCQAQLRTTKEYEQPGPSQAKKLTAVVRLDYRPSCLGAAALNFYVATIMHMPACSLQTPCFHSMLACWRASKNSYDAPWLIKLSALNVGELWYDEVTSTSAWLSYSHLSLNTCGHGSARL